MTDNKQRPNIASRPMSWFSKHFDNMSNLKEELEGQQNNTSYKKEDLDKTRPQILELYSLLARLVG